MVVKCTARKVHAQTTVSEGRLPAAKVKDLTCTGNHRRHIYLRNVLPMQSKRSISDLK